MTNNALVLLIPVTR